MFQKAYLKNNELDIEAKHIQLQFEGFCNTPLLWKNDAVFNLNQYYLKTETIPQFNGFISKNLRLGKRVERFVAYLLKQHLNCTILAENIQIQEYKNTVGEIDFLLIENNIPIHLEVVYKFYLYNNTIGTDEIEHFIGPNKKDSLLQKLIKLKQKQLPIIYHKATENVLNKLQIPLNQIQQKVLFKAQLFFPFNEPTQKLTLLNNQCKAGYYIGYTAISVFKDCKFFLPLKANWLQTINLHVKWLSFNEFMVLINPIIQQKTSPLCWVKKTNGEVFKLFIVWW